MVLLLPFPGKIGSQESKGSKGPQKAPQASKSGLSGKAGAANARETLIALFNATRAETSAFEYDQKTGRVFAFYKGGVAGSFDWARPDGKKDRVKLFADRVVVLTEVLKTDPAEEGKETGKSAGPEGAAKAGEGKDRGPDRIPKLAPPQLYAEGNVRIEAKEVILETDGFFYDAGKKKGLLVGSRGYGELSALSYLALGVPRRDFSRMRSVSGEDIGFGGIGEIEATPPSEKKIPSAEVHRWKRIVVFRAEVLRALDLQHFEGEGVAITNCEYGVPHLAITTAAARIYPAPRDEEPEESAEEKGEKDHYIITTGGSLLRLGGVPVLPLPPARYNTKWAGQMPIRSIRPGNSSKYGAFLETEWNLNWAFEQTPITRLSPVRMFLEESRLGFATDYYSKRGLGWGPQGIYGKHPRSWAPWELKPDLWNFYGEGGYYSIRDEGEDRTSSVQFEDPDRYWSRIVHEQSIPHVGIIDVEYSRQSDPNFLNEYFEEVQKEEKPQESLAYFRRSFRDNIAVTGLYKYRTNDFETTVERVPEGKLYLLEQPVARTGLYTGLLLQGAELRERQAEGSNEPDVSQARFDAVNDWALPFGLGRYVRLRPFADARFTEFEHSLDPEADPRDREALGAGITGSQEYSRIFTFSRGGIAERWFGFTQLKHEVIPKVTYRNLYLNTVEPEELIPFDEVETVSTDERVELSLRNEILVRRPVPPEKPLAGSARARDEKWTGRDNLVRLPAETRSLLDFEVSTDWFTHPARDNEGKRFSYIDADFTLRPNDRIALRSRSFFDPTESMRFEATDTSVAVIPREALRITVGERYTRDATSFLYTQGDIQFSKKYLLDVYYSYDFELGSPQDVEIRLFRIFHKWALELGYAIDFGEDKNQTFSVNVQPVELLEEMRARRGRLSNR